ncbi:MAG: tyrosine-protein phosphatase [Pirellulales bacterium]
MPYRTVGRLLVVLLAVAAAVGGYFAFWRYHVKRFQEVRPAAFYRVAQPTEFGIRHLAERYGIKTMLSVQLYDFRLRRGLLDRGAPSGDKESKYVASLGIRHVQWPMGAEACWPWVTPWQFEEFFKLLDDPDNLPVAVHCQGGRHRTGTLSALFRLEYDRWPVQRALDEMHAFDFGPPVTLQEHNLRTYLPRPHPQASDWSILAGYWRGRLGMPEPADYEQLIRRLRTARPSGSLEADLSQYLDEGHVFALPLAQRLIDAPDDPLVSRATRLAAQCLEDTAAAAADWSAAAALVADFGKPSQQQRLKDLLGDASFQRASPLRFDRIVAGVTNRYRPNRIAYLLPLLENESHHLEEAARRYRYCDTAVSRLSATININFREKAPGMGVDAWNHARQAARAWCDANPRQTKPATLRPAAGRTLVRSGDGPQAEDLSKLPVLLK